MVPLCGPRLITAKRDESIGKTIKNLGNAKIPKYTSLSCEVSTNDHFENMNIFTEFGDLTPSQILTLFNTFLNWPEYRECPFLASLENALLKLETSMEGSTVHDALEIHDDIEIAAGETEVEKNADKKKVV